MPTRDHIAGFVKMVEAGQYIEAMEAFYADDVTAQENNDEPRVGLQTLLAHERRTLETAGRAKARCVSPPIIDGDTVVLHWEFLFPSPNGKPMRLEELVLQTWRGDKLASERFFYDPRQLRPAPT